MVAQSGAVPGRLGALWFSGSEREIGAAITHKTQVHRFINPYDPARGGVVRVVGDLPGLVRLPEESALHFLELRLHRQTIINFVKFGQSSGLVIGGKPRCPESWYCQSSANYTQSGLRAV